MEGTNFRKFVEFYKYDYRDVSDPNASLRERLKNFKLLYSKWSFKTTYLKDVKYLSTNPDIERGKRKKMSMFYQGYKLTDVLIGIYAVHSLYWHYKRNYFRTNKVALEIYIVTKIIFNIILLNSLQFFTMKTVCDPILYEHFTKKEEEWDRLYEIKKKEMGDISLYKKIRSKSE